MSALDYGLLTVVLFSGFMAVLRGFVREMVGLIGWISAYMVAARFSNPLAGYLGHWIQHPAVVHALSVFILFILTLVLFFGFGRVLKLVVDQAGLSITDRFFGLCFGLTRGVLILMIGCLLFQYFYQEQQPPTWISSSLFYPYLIQGADEITQRIPPEWVLTLPTMTPTPINLEQVSAPLIDP